MFLESAYQNDFWRINMITSNDAKKSSFTSNDDVIILMMLKIQLYQNKLHF